MVEDVVQSSDGIFMPNNGIITFSDCVVTFSESFLQFNYVKGVQVVGQTVRAFSWYCANLVTKWAGDLAWRRNICHFLIKEKSILCWNFKYFKTQYHIYLCALGAESVRAGKIFGLERLAIKSVVTDAT